MIFRQPRVDGPMGAKRIAFLIDHFYSDRAGTENQLVKIIHGMAGKYDIELISFRDSDWLRAAGAALPCTIRIFQIDRFKRFYTYRNLHRLAKHLRRTNPALVHTFFPVANIAGVLCARLAGVPRIVASRRDYGEWMRPHYLMATRYANRYVDRIVTNSDRVKRLTERAEGVEDNRIDVIYNGIDVNRFSALTPDISVRQELGIPAEGKVVGIIANFRPMKRHETFIQAANLVVAQNPDVHFLLVGSDDGIEGIRREAESLAERLGVSHRLYFVGSRSDVSRYLSVMDIGVNCSEGEGLSNAIMEYMAAGIPCVVSDSGGNPDLITDGVTGYTFPLGDHERLARKIIEMLGSGERNRALAERARSKLYREMSMAAMVNKFDALYDLLINGSTRSPDRRCAVG